MGNPTDEEDMARRTNLSLAALRSALAEGDEPDATLDMGRAQRMGGFFWLFGGVVAAALLPFSPPTEIGWPGWVLAAAGIGACVTVARRRLDARRIPDMDEIFWAGWVGLVMIVLIEWLAGGRAAPYHHLYVLPALYGAAIHNLRRSLIFVAAVVAAMFAPLFYGPASGEIAVDVVAQALMLVALAMTSRVLFTITRVQRGRLQRAREEADVRARRDPLTGLGNRLAFQEAVEREVARARRTGSQLCVVLGDLDDFKRINDSFGHIRGDECLTAAAGTIARAARGGEECFRWGGDEFALLLPDTSRAEADKARERMCSVVRRECLAPDGRPLELVCGTTALVEGQGVNELVAEVDGALITLKTGERPASD